MPLQQGISQEVYCHRYIYDSEAYHSTALNILQTALNVTGRGKASILRIMGAVDETHNLKVTVDGNVIINNRAIGSYIKVGVFCGIFEFNNSLLIEHKSSGGVNDVRLVVSYCVR